MGSKPNFLAVLSTIFQTKSWFFLFYAPEVHIMYLTVSSWIQISCIMRGSGLNRALKFLTCSPTPSPPHGPWNLPCGLLYIKPPMHLWYMYTALCIMFWMRAYPLLGQVGGGWALEISSFLGPKCHLPMGFMPFHRAQKTLTPTRPHNGYVVCTHPKHYGRAI